jgi:hypothetical protein
MSEAWIPFPSTVKERKEKRKTRNLYSGREGAVIKHEGLIGWPSKLSQKR